MYTSRRTMLLAGFGLATSVIAGSATLAPVAEAAAWPKTLKLSQSGPDVRRLQDILRVKGFFNHATTGSFQQVTDRAARAYQGANGLRPDGIVGPATWERLLGGASSAAPSQPSSTKSGVGVGFNTKTGMERQVQERLEFHKDPRGRPYYVGTIDGSFGVGSMNGLLTFQRAWPGLKVTGLVDQATWDALMSNEQRYVTNGPGSIPAGDGIITSISQRTSWVVKGGKVVETLDSRTAGWKTDKRSGQWRIHVTPTGDFKIYQKHVRTPSVYFGDDAMPHSLVFNPNVYVHGSPLFDVQGYSGGSYACINLKTKDAAWLWPQMPIGARVRIIP